MKTLCSCFLAAFILVCLVVGSERRAFAYVDPGSGLVALQTLASVAAAGAYVIRRRIRTLFGWRRKPVDLPVLNNAGQSGKTA